MENKIDLIVGNTAFELSLKDLKALDSNFLDTLTDPDTNFRKPEDNIFSIHDADPVYFEAFLKTMRSGIPSSILLIEENEEVMWQEVDFWGMKDKIQRFIKVVAPSAARVIQRALFVNLVCKRLVHHMNYCPRPREILSDYSTCCVCGVRLSTANEWCELSHCYFKDRNREFYVYDPCGLRRPDLAMGIFYCPHERESFDACFKCKGTCDGICFY